MLEIRLLGAPSLTRDGGPARLGGRKTWGLLALLLLEAPAPTRAAAISRLTPDADDPQAAFRWLLHQVRRAVGPEADIDAADDRLAIRTAGEVRVDALSLFDGSADPDWIATLPAAELLEGMAFDDAPEFELWLTLQRSRTRSALAEAFRWAATQRAVTDPTAALTLAERGLGLDPYDDAKHELLVDLLVQAGDRRGAMAHVEAADRLFRTELGEELPETVRRPLERRRSSTVAATAASARAQLETARAQAATGGFDHDHSILAARRAADAAVALRDPALELAALTLLASTLIHTRRGRDAEAKGLLGRAAQIAAELGDDLALADIERELGYVELVQGDHGSAEPRLRHALALADAAGDQGRAGRARTYVGMLQNDLGRPEIAEPLLRAAVEQLALAGDPGWLGYAQGSLGRTMADLGDVAGGRAIAIEGVANARLAGRTVVLPWPMLVAAEAARLMGDLDAAEDLFTEALTLGRELDDPCWEGLGLRGLGLLRCEGGDRPGAIELLDEALSACHRYPDVYAWARALILVDIVELQDGADPSRIAVAQAAVTSSPWPALAARLRPWLGREQQTPVLTTAS